MTETGAKRLTKVARELNISVGTIVDFLHGKGFSIDSNPNSKISDDAYAHLLKEFQSDKKAKEESSQMLNTKIQQKKEVLATKEETKPVAAPAPVAQSPVAEPEPLPTKKTAKEKLPEAPEKKDAAEKEETKEEVIKARSEEEIGLKVKGKIDLDKLESKSKADKNKTETSKKSKTEKEAAPIEAAPIADSEAVSVPVPDIVAEVPTAPTAPEPAKEDNVHITQYEKLEGPKVLGKMVLPVKEEKKKPAAAADSAEKKKRKRIKKKAVNTELFKDKSAQGNNRPSGPGSGPGSGNRRNAPSREVKAELTPEEIQNQIKETLARLSGGGKSKASKFRREKRAQISEKIQEALEQKEAEKSILKVTEFVSASELARMMNVPINEIISTCMSLGMFVSINQRLSAETIVIVAEEFGYKVEFVSAEDTVVAEEEKDDENDLTNRAPIVTVMGHVDHGKTSLLDYIRKANVIAGEAGGITQHIGAYSVKLDSGKRIAFLDTPGHEAFTAMRARGAQVTDIVIVVVAADDSVMPQTREAINHAQAAGVPIIIAINKIDKPGANPDKIREELAGMNILVEEWGGKYQCQEISAKKGTNIDVLLEKVLLEAELLDLKANAKKNAVGTIIESSLDKGRGYISTVLVQAGTLRVGDVVLAGSFSGRVKALTNERNMPIKEAGPSTPALLLGLSGAPTAGDKFKVMEDEREAREIANKRMQLLREQGYRTNKHITLDEIGRRLAIGDFKELNIIVKGDVDGSIEALTDSLLKLSTEKIQVNVIHKSVGQVTESDVLLASASNAIIVGFQVRPSANARKLAEQEQIEIRLYSIIYDAINEVKAAMEGMLAPEFEEKITGNIQIRQVFKISKVGSVAGCMVTDGKINRNTKVRIIRDGIVIHTGELGSLKRFKDDVKEVSAGYECGLNIERFNDIQEGDIIEGFEMVEIKKKS
jgi:translation initiation factor IF-2